MLAVSLLQQQNRYQFLTGMYFIVEGVLEETELRCELHMVQSISSAAGDFGAWFTPL